MKTVLYSILMFTILLNMSCSKDESEDMTVVYGDYKIEISTPNYTIPYNGEKKELNLSFKREKTMGGKKEYVTYPMTGTTIKSLLSITTVTIDGEEGTYKVSVDTPRNELNREIEQSVSFYSGEDLLGVLNIVQEKNPEGKTGHVVTLESSLVWKD